MMAGGILNFTLATLLLQVVNGGNVLVMHPLYSGSHEVQLRGLSEVLVNRGHSVTIVKFKNFIDIPNTNPNITLIQLAVDNSEGDHPYITVEKEGRFYMPQEILWKYGHYPWGIPEDAFRTMFALCKSLFMDNPSTLKYLADQHFDVAIVDLFTNECGLALINQLGIPAVAYWALPLNSGEVDYSSISLPPSYIPTFMSQLTDRMSYFQRVKNYIYKLGSHIVMQYQFYNTNWYIQKAFPGSPHPSELIGNLSGILENSDFALDYPRALPPNVINVGCMQCRAGKSLPKDLEEFMSNSSSAGVVLFAMGATFDAGAPGELVSRLMAVFSRLPQRFLVKLNRTPPNTPPNVRIVRWLPQQDVLAHPNIRAFFTHCGMHGAMETLYHGVPVIGMPIFGDQTDVIEMIKNKGLGVRLDKDASEEEIYSAIVEVVNNHKYRQNALKCQALIHDQPQSAMDRAVWFVEHVIRTQGAAHLKLSSRYLNIFQLYGLDVIPVLILFAVFAMYIAFRILMFIFNCVVTTLTRVVGSCAGERKDIKEVSLQQQEDIGFEKLFGISNSRSRTITLKKKNR